MTGPKTNETAVRQLVRSRRTVDDGGRRARAVARYVRVSPTKVREVLDLIRGLDVERAQEVLRFSQRDAAAIVAKALGSAVANAETNESLLADELFVSSCYADEGPTLKRWRPRARGRATRIRKRTCHVTVIVSRLPEDELRAKRARSAPATDRRRRRQQRRQPTAAPTTPTAEEQAIAEQATAPPPEEPTPAGEGAEVEVPVTEEVPPEVETPAAEEQPAPEATEEEKPE